MVNYTFSITVDTFTAELLLNGFHFTEISVWLVFLSFLFSFFHLCCFSSTTVRKMCLLDISNFLENSKKNYFAAVFHSCHGKIPFLGDWPTNSTELLRDLCAWENLHGLKNLIWSSKAWPDVSPLSSGFSLHNARIDTLVLFLLFE